MEDRNGLRRDKALVGNDIRFCFAYEAKRLLRNVHIAFNLQEQLGDAIVNCNTSDVGQDLTFLPERGVLVCEIKKFPLRAARYTGNLLCRVQGCIADWIQGAFVAEILDGDFYGTGKIPSQGKLFVVQDWTVRNMANRTTVPNGSCGVYTDPSLTR
jgi:lipopolysaccharide transport system ATP-binding protein